MAGRPTKLTSEVQEKIVSAIRGGSYIETAAAYAGIVKSTLYAWLKAGERERERITKLREQYSEEAIDQYRIPEKQACLEFSNAVETALAEAELRDLQIVNRAAKGGAEVTEITVKIEQYVDKDGYLHEREVERTERTKVALPTWQAAAWKLERRNQDRWGRKRVELTGADGSPLEVGASNVVFYIPDNGRDAEEVPDDEE